MASGAHRDHEAPGRRIHRFRGRVVTPVVPDLARSGFHDAPVVFSYVWPLPHVPCPAHAGSIVRAMPMPTVPIRFGAYVLHRVCVPDFTSGQCCDLVCHRVRSLSYVTSPAGPHAFPAAPAACGEPGA